MSSRRDRTRPPLLPRTHYFVSVSRGESIRTAKVRPAALWTLLALAPLSLCFGAAGLGYLALHDDLLRAVVQRQAQIERSYERRLSEAIKLETAARRRLSDQAVLESKLQGLLFREAELERRSAAVAALAIASAPVLGPPLEQAEPIVHRVEEVSPTGPQVGASGLRGRVSRDSSSRGGAGPGASERLERVGRSLDRLEAEQTKAIAAIGASARRISGLETTILSDVGLDPAKLAAAHPAGLGGPFVPLEASPRANAFDLAAAEAARDLAAAERLKALMPFIPLRKPLNGEPPVSSPFGYRTDPFLGRLALHTGVDLLQEIGAEIHATAAGRVAFAGFMGGYGAAVEVDHGNGLATRYGHMSEILVADGQEVAPGAVLGRVGSSGRSSGPHLHYEVRMDGEPVDPERFLQAGAQLSAAR